MRRVVAFVGISGVGKSFFLERTVTNRQAVVVSASKLIASQRDALGHSIPHDDLRLANLDVNQRLLIEGFRRLPVGKLPVIIDGHTIIDTPTGEVEVPAQVFKHLEVTDFVVLVDDPAAIVTRRDRDLLRKRPIRSVEEITAHQKRACEAAKAISTQLNLPLITIAHSDAEALLELLKS